MREGPEKDVERIEVRPLPVAASGNVWRVTRLFVLARGCAGEFILCKRL